MSEKDLANVDNLNIEPLTDDDLDAVAGGRGDDCSCTYTTGACSSSETEGPSEV